MSDVLLEGTFSADGSSDEIVFRKATILVGDSDGSDFGSGTVNLECTFKGSNFTTVHSFTEEGAQTTIEFIGGIKGKLTLVGSTSPDINYQVKYIL